MRTLLISTIVLAGCVSPVPVSIDAPAPGTLEASPGSLSASAGVGVPVEDLTVTVTGVGPGIVQDLTARITGSSDFTIKSSHCGNLTPGQRCTIELSFTASAVAPMIESNLVVTSPSGASATVALHGTGEPPTDLRIASSQATSELGYAAVGHPSQRSITFTVTTVGAVATGPLTTGFTHSNGFVRRSDTCAGQSVSPTGSCTIVVGFDPTVVGMRETFLDVSGTPGGLIRAPLQGIGVATDNIISISPTAHVFAATTVGQTSAAQTFTITNTGSVPTGTLTTSMTLGDAAQFTVTGNGCTGTVVAPAGTCTYAVAFAPTATGQKLTQFEVMGAGNPSGTTLLGTGQ